MQPHDTTAQQIEEWRDIPNYDGVYQVSDLGRVRSVDRNITYRNRWGTETTYFKAEHILKPYPNQNGYPQVNLFHPERGYSPTMIHTVVAQAFIGQRPEGHDIHHKNECRDDNRLRSSQSLPQSAIQETPEEPFLQECGYDNQRDLDARRQRRIRRRQSLNQRPH